MEDEVGQVHADEGEPEVDVTQPLVVHPTCHGREEEVQRGEHAHHCPAEEHVVQVGHHPVRVLDLDVQGEGAVEHPRDAADDEQKEEAYAEHHRCLELWGRR